MTRPDLVTSRNPLDHPDLVPLGIAPLLRTLRARWIGVMILEAGLWALVIALSLLIALNLSTRLTPLVAMLWAAGGGVTALIIFVLLLLRRIPDGFAMARLADRALALDEKISSIIEIYRHSMERTAVAQSLRATTAQALGALGPNAGCERYFSPRRAGLVGIAAVLFAFLIAGHLTTDLPRLILSPSLGADDITELADLLAEQALEREDEVLAAIVEDLERADAESQSERFAADLRQTLQRAGSRFGSNRAHDFLPFQGASAGLAERVQEFMQGDVSSPTPLVAAGGGVDMAPEDLASDDINAMPLDGGGDDGASLGLSPAEDQGGDGLIEDEESGRDLEMPAPQMKGQAQGSGMGQTNMAGTGEGDEAAIPLDALPPPGFAETEEISATQREGGETTRVGMNVDEIMTKSGPVETGREWPFVEPVVVERSLVPPESEGAVQAYFERNLEDGE